jgi:aminoglycoside phosphotransferase family enzyme/predicted kinase
MHLDALLALLSRPASFPQPTTHIRVCHTHISVVFVTDQFAYKIKKPVSLGFLDFSTLERRRYFCEEEVRLNRRLAPEVYLGVVPVTAGGMEGPGEPVEWAVKMVRLPDEATLEQRLQRGEVEEAVLENIARRVAEFHRQAESTPRIHQFGRQDVVARNARENLDQVRPLIGATLSAAVWERLVRLTDQALRDLEPLIDARAARGVPCDTHGDLHLDHVYLFPERLPPADLAIIDCIEFNERFRFADPIADVAFLVMDLKFHFRADLAAAFAVAYLEAAGDTDGGALLSFYTAYRAAVRGKVEGFELAEREVPAEERAAALVRARAHWLLALAELEEPGRRPYLLLTAGLPGSGKSTLARGLAERAGFVWIPSDGVRKELAATSTDTDLYTPAWHDRTYAECLRRAETLLFEGRRVLVDASFWEERRRQVFLECARRWGVPVRILYCHADPATVRERLAGRINDLSDADWSVHQRLATHWEPPGQATRLFVVAVDTSGSREDTLAMALAALPWG